ncbi:tetratricopeptide repeat protein [gut metagenome]|uniref:Tetratricopeptide repeat protein n=1 Tax=gut metagenome TaxID=749906 RepID=J9C326_9ZZZZ
MLHGEETARYALLYSEALDKIRINNTDDSLICMAIDYYQHPDTEETSHYYYRALFLKGKMKLRTGDRLAALRIFLLVEKNLKETSSDLLGLVYEQLGDIYYQQMNYNRAVQYFQEARHLFRKNGAMYEETLATLDVAATYFRLKTPQQAIKYYSHALYLADEYQYQKLSHVALSNLATLYMRWEKDRIPAELLKCIEASARQDTLNGYHTLMDVKILKNELDSISYYWQLAEKNTKDIRDLADLEYTAFRVAVQSGHPEEAIRHIHQYIYLNDSLTRANMQFSGGMIEREFFKEQAKFADYRMRSQIIQKYTLAGIGLLILLLSYIVFRHRIRIQRERTDHYLYLAEEAKTQYNSLMQTITAQKHQESMLKGLVSNRFEIIDRLGKNYYEREGTSSQQSSIFQQVRRIIQDFSEREDIYQELEKNVNICHDNAMEKLRTDFPKMKANDIRLLCYIFVGFSPQIISLFMKDTVANIYARKSRLKSRIKTSESLHKELFLGLFE